ncbi:MAG: hypothetical protein WCF85_19740 [Rhodospirillaceae bacterium]
MKIAEIIDKVAPSALPVYRQAFDRAEQDLAEYGIDTPLRLAHFLSQVLHESGGLTVLRESMRYTHGERILEIFGAGHHSAAIRPDELPGLVGNAEALAERVYGRGNPKKALELGNMQPGDGYRYRGNGMIQITGRFAHERFGKLLQVDLEAAPELATDPRYCLRLAAAEWRDNRCNEAADLDDIERVTRLVNGGLNGLAERRAWLAKVRPLAFAVTFQVPVVPAAMPSPGQGPAPQSWFVRLIQFMIKIFKRK